MAYQTTPSGLQFEDIVAGSGAEAVRGNHASVHYTGWLFENGEAGRRFDSSKAAANPSAFLWAQVMWLQAGMKV